MIIQDFETGAPFVMVDVARRALEKIGLEAPKIDSDYYMFDDFIDQTRPIFPLYPPIASILDQSAATPSA